MAWTKTQLLDFWNTYINTNGSQAITGSIMNEGGVEIINAMALLTDLGVPEWYEPTHSGTNGAVSITIATATTVTVGEGDGYIIDSYSIPEEPNATAIAWFEQTLTVSDGTESGVRHLFIDSGGNAVVAVLTPQLRRTHILVGAVWLIDGAIDFVAQIPDVINNTANDVIDYISFHDLKSRSKGAEVYPVTAAPSIWHGTGEVFILGGNRNNNPANPNIVPLPERGSDTVPYEFDVVLSDGTVHEAGITVIPDYYDDGAGGVDNLGNNKATIFYVYRTLGGVVVLQPSQIEYDSGDFAGAALQSDLGALVPFPNASSFILQAQIWWQEGSPSFTDPLLAGISNFTSSVGGSTSSGGGGSTDYINAGTFNTTNGTLSLTGIGSAGASVNLDGRYSTLADGTTLGQTLVWDGANWVVNDRITDDGTDVYLGETDGYIRIEKPNITAQTNSDLKEQTTRYAIDPASFVIQSGEGGSKHDDDNTTYTQTADSIEINSYSDDTIPDQQSIVVTPTAITVPYLTIGSIIDDKSLTTKEYVDANAGGTYNKWIVGADGTYNDVLSGEIVEFLAGTGMTIAREAGAGFVRYTLNAAGGGDYDYWRLGVDLEELQITNNTLVKFVGAGGTTIEQGSISGGYLVTITSSGSGGGEWTPTTGGIYYLQKTIVGGSTVLTEQSAVQGDFRATGYARVGHLENDGYERQSAIKEVTGDYTVNEDTDRTLLAYTTGTITLPVPDSGNQGQILVIKKTLSGSPTTISGSILDAATVSSLSMTIVGECVTLQCGNSVSSGGWRWIVTSWYKPS